MYFESSDAQGKRTPVDSSNSNGSNVRTGVSDTILAYVALPVLRIGQIPFGIQALIEFNKAKNKKAENNGEK